MDFDTLSPDNQLRLVAWAHQVLIRYCKIWNLVFEYSRLEATDPVIERWTVMSSLGSVIINMRSLDEVIDLARELHTEIKNHDGKPERQSITYYLHR